MVEARNEDTGEETAKEVIGERKQRESQNERWKMEAVEEMVKLNITNWKRTKMLNQSITCK